MLTRSSRSGLENGYRLLVELNTVAIEERWTSRNRSLRTIQSSTIRKPRHGERFSGPTQRVPTAVWRAMEAAAMRRDLSEIRMLSRNSIRIKTESYGYLVRRDFGPLQRRLDRTNHSTCKTPLHANDENIPASISNGHYLSRIGNIEMLLRHSFESPKT